MLRTSFGVFSVATEPEDLAVAVRRVDDQTADRIRTVLSEDQKKKYNRPLPAGALSTQANADVEGGLRRRGASLNDEAYLGICHGNVKLSLVALVIAVLAISAAQTTQTPSKSRTPRPGR